MNASFGNQTLVISGNQLGDVRKQIGRPIDDLKVPGKQGQATTIHKSSGSYLKSSGKDQFVLSTAHGLKDKTATIVTFNQKGIITGASLGDVKTIGGSKTSKEDFALIKIKDGEPLKAEPLKLALDGSSSEKDITLQNPLTGGNYSDDKKVPIIGNQNGDFILNNPDSKIGEGASGSAGTQKINGEEKIVSVTRSKEVGSNKIHASKIQDNKEALRKLFAEFGQNINAFA